VEHPWPPDAGGHFFFINDYPLEVPMEGYSLKDMRGMLRGRWFDVFQTYAPQLSHAMERCPRHVPCPKTGRGKDNFRFFPTSNETGAAVSNGMANSQFSRNDVITDGINLLCWVNDWDTSQAYKVLAHYLGLDLKDKNKLSLPKPALEKQPATRPTVWNETVIEELNLWWDQDWVPLKESKLAVRYFQNRGIDPECLPGPQVMRYKSKLQLGKSRRLHPALISLVKRPGNTAAGKAVGLHKIYLEPDGSKLKIDKPKRMSPAIYEGAYTGASVRLYPADQRILAVTEGIETAIAVRQATGLPVWAALNTGMMRNFEPPGHVDQLVIYADHDTPKPDPISQQMKEFGAGEEAARALQERLTAAGVQVIILKPEKADTDWNDVLLAEGIKGVPLPEFV
jgi:putative DNA primase/helicase